MLFTIIFASVAGMLIWTTVRGRDAFPFSHYPMFSDSTDISKVEVFRIALENSNGDIYWWKSEFYRYPEFIGRQFKKLYYAEGDLTQKAFINLEKQRLLAEVVRLIELEDKTLESVRNLHIVKRRASSQQQKSGEISVKDEIIEIIPLGKIRKNDP